MDTDPAVVAAEVAAITVVKVNDANTSYPKLQEFVKRLKQFCSRNRIPVRKQPGNAKRSALVKFCTDLLPTVKRALSANAKREAEQEGDQQGAREGDQEGAQDVDREGAREAVQEGAQDAAQSSSSQSQTADSPNRSQSVNVTDGARGTTTVHNTFSGTVYQSADQYRGFNGAVHIHAEQYKGFDGPVYNGPVIHNAEQYKGFDGVVNNNEHMVHNDQKVIYAPMVLGDAAIESTRHGGYLAHLLRSHDHAVAMAMNPRPAGPHASTSRGGAPPPSAASSTTSAAHSSATSSSVVCPTSSPTNSRATAMSAGRPTSSATNSSATSSGAPSPVRFAPRVHHSGQQSATNPAAGAAVVAATDRNGGAAAAAGFREEGRRGVVGQSSVQPPVNAETSIDGKEQQLRELERKHDGDDGGEEADDAGARGAKAPAEGCKGGEKHQPPPSPPPPSGGPGDGTSAPSSSSSSSGSSSRDVRGSNGVATEDSSGGSHAQRAADCLHQLDALRIDSEESLAATPQPPQKSSTGVSGKTGAEGAAQILCALSGGNRCGGAEAQKKLGNAITARVELGNATEARGKLGSGAEARGKLGSGAEARAELDGAIKAREEIGSGAEAHKKIGSGAEARKKIGSGAEARDMLDNGADASEKLGNGAKASEKLGNGTEASEKLGNGAEASEKIGSGAEASEKIGSGAEAHEKIGSGADACEKLGGGAEASEKLCGGAEASEKLGNGAEASEKLGGGAETREEIGGAIQLCEKYGGTAVSGEEIRARKWPLDVTEQLCPTFQEGVLRMKRKAVQSAIRELIKFESPQASLTKTVVMNAVAHAYNGGAMMLPPLDLPIASDACGSASSSAAPRSRIDMLRTKRGAVKSAIGKLMAFESPEVRPTMLLVSKTVLGLYNRGSRATPTLTPQTSRFSMPTPTPAPALPTPSSGTISTPSGPQRDTRRPRGTISTPSCSPRADSRRDTRRRVSKAEAKRLKESRDRDPVALKTRSRSRSTSVRRRGVPSRQALPIGRESLRRDAFADNQTSARATRGDSMSRSRSSSLCRGSDTSLPPSPVVPTRGQPPPKGRSAVHQRSSRLRAGTGHHAAGGPGEGVGTMIGWPPLVFRDDRVPRLPTAGTPAAGAKKRSRSSGGSGAFPPAAWPSSGTDTDGDALMGVEATPGCGGYAQLPPPLDLTGSGGKGAKRRRVAK